MRIASPPGVKSPHMVVKGFVLVSTFHTALQAVSSSPSGGTKASKSPPPGSVTACDSTLSFTMAAKSMPALHMSSVVIDSGSDTVGPGKTRSDTHKRHGGGGGAGAGGTGCGAGGPG